MLIVMDEQRVILDHLYEVVAGQFSCCEVHRLGKAEQKNLKLFFRRHSFQSFDRVVVFSRLKRLRNQVALLKCIPGLVFLEHDACQNYMDESKYQGEYSKFYRRLPWSRLLTSGFSLAARFRDEGLDAVFVSKGYDEQALGNTHQDRDIPLAFVGSVKGDAYHGRKAMVESIASRTQLLVTRTESGEAYGRLLNRIRVFISADVGMGEFMIKNFEAMACGCVLLAWSQGDQEDAAIGLEDGKNAMLYRSADEAVAKIEKLNADPQLAARIARAGQAFVEQQYTFARVGRDLAEAIEQPMRPWPGVPTWHRLWMRLRHGIKI